MSREHHNRFQQRHNPFGKRVFRKRDSEEVCNEESEGPLLPDIFLGRTPVYEKKWSKLQVMQSVKLVSESISH